MKFIANIRFILPQPPMLSRLLCRVSVRVDSSIVADVMLEILRRTNSMLCCWLACRLEKMLSEAWKRVKQLLSCFGRLFVPNL